MGCFTETLPSYIFVSATSPLQQAVYERIGVPVVDEVFKGYSSTILCYGQVSVQTWRCLL
jgi:hypothetical protein